MPPPSPPAMLESKLQNVVEIGMEVRTNNALRNASGTGAPLEIPLKFPELEAHGHILGQATSNPLHTDLHDVSSNAEPYFAAA